MEPNKDVQTQPTQPTSPDTGAGPATAVMDKPNNMGALATDPSEKVTHPGEGIDGPPPVPGVTQLEDTLTGPPQVQVGSADGLQTQNPEANNSSGEASSLPHPDVVIPAPSSPISETQSKNEVPGPTLPPINGMETAPTEKPSEEPVAQVGSMTEPQTTNVTPDASGMVHSEPSIIDNSQGTAHSPVESAMPTEPTGATVTTPATEAQTMPQESTSETTSPEPVGPVSPNPEPQANSTEPVTDINNTAPSIPDGDSKPVEPPAVGPSVGEDNPGAPTVEPEQASVPAAPETTPPKKGLGSKISGAVTGAIQGMFGHK